MTFGIVAMLSVVLYLRAVYPSTTLIYILRPPPTTATTIMPPYPVYVPCVVAPMLSSMNATLPLPIHFQDGPIYSILPHLLLLLSSSLLPYSNRNDVHLCYLPPQQPFSVLIPCLLIYLPTYLPTYLPIFLSTHLLSIYLPIYPPTYPLPTFPPTLYLSHPLPIPPPTPPASLLSLPLSP